MAKTSKRRKLHKDAEIASGLFFLLVLYFLCFPMTALFGVQTFGFILTALQLFVTFYLLLSTAFPRVISGLIAPMMSHGHLTEASLIMKYGFWMEIVPGIILAGLSSLSAIPLSRFLSGSDKMYLTLAFLAPGFLIFGLSGYFRTFFHSVGVGKLNAWLTCLQVMLFLVFAPVFGRIGNGYGKKAASLLQNPLCVPLYSACGIITGLNMAAFLVVIIMFILFLLFNRYFRRSGAELPSIRIRGFERSIFGHVLQSVAPVAVCFILSGTVLLIDLKISRWLFPADSRETVLQEIGGMYGIGFAAVFMLTCLALIFFTSGVKKAEYFWKKGSKRRFTAEMQTVRSQSFYILLPVSFFAVAAAPALTHGILDVTDGPALISMRILSVSIFLMGETAIHSALSASAGRTRGLVLSAAAAFFLQGTVYYILEKRTALGIYAFSICFSIYYFLRLLILLIVERDLFRIGREAIRFLMIMICSVLACFPIYFVADKMVAAMGTILTLIILLPVYLIIYVPLSILTGGADLESLSQLPGGGLIIHMAKRFSGGRYR